MIERRMTFHPVKYDLQAPWPLPEATADVYFPTSDGIRLHGWFFSSNTPRTGITVLFLHGNADTVGSAAAAAIALRRCGFDVLLVDYRGYGRSEGESTGESTLKLDGAAALRYLTAERGLAPSTIALFGYSLGTTLAADLAASSPCHAVALVAPLATSRLQAQAVFPLLPELFYERMRNRFDTVSTIAQARCPVMILHGDRDSTISLEHGRAVYERAPHPKRLLVMQDIGHWLPLDGRYPYLDELVSFFAPRP